MLSVKVKGDCAASFCLADNRFPSYRSPNTINTDYLCVKDESSQKRRQPLLN